jgi:hypothetical protein
MVNNNKTVIQIYISIWAWANFRALAFLNPTIGHLCMIIKFCSLDPGTLFAIQVVCFVQNLKLQQTIKTKVAYKSMQLTKKTSC